MNCFFRGPKTAPYFFSDYMEFLRKNGKINGRHFPMKNNLQYSGVFLFFKKKKKFVKLDELYMYHSFQFYSN